jgi:predicted amidohydrolase YtcJ
MMIVARMRVLAILGMAAFALPLAAGWARADVPPADLVLVNGRILTVDTQDHVAQALAIRNGLIEQVGDDRSVRRLIGPMTRIINLQGRAATPGLIDTHAHILETGLGELFEIELAGASSVQDMVQAVARRVATTPKGAWVVGNGWDEGKFPDGRYPTAADLDAVSPDNPVWLENTTGHYGVANSRALKLAGLSATTPAPPAGTIERLSDGRPAGVLKETAARLVTMLIPPFTLDQRRQALTHMIARLNAEGMTGYKDPAISPDDWAAYVGLARERAFPMNACVLFAAGPTLATATKALGVIQAAKAEAAAVSGAVSGANSWARLRRP